MNLNEIRTRMVQIGAERTSEKRIFCDWAAKSTELNLQLGLTLMPKKVFYKHVPAYKRAKNNELKRHLNGEELNAALLRFLDILSKVTYKNGYVRFGKKIKAIYTIEGAATLKDLHVHLAMAKPEHLSWNEFARRVKKALELSDEFCIFNDNNLPVAKTDAKAGEYYRYKLDLIDEGWLTYITKELGNKQAHKVRLY